MHKIIRALILSDLFILGSFGLIQPIFAVFMLKNISGASLIAIGVATTIQLLTKSLFQMLVAKWTDEERGNKRELITLFVGSILMSAVPFGFVFAQTLNHVYILQFIYGLGGALAFPGWVVIFTRYLRDEKAGYEWGIYNTTVSLGTATAAFLGAYLADFYSFRLLFVIVGLLSLLGTSFIIHIFRHEFSGEEKI
ncbi:MFS transporter [Patescibacteria group bacterium]|nr:MAG: MFS transporter [Patescibacteria group bacterium]